MKTPKQILFDRHQSVGKDLSKIRARVIATLPTTLDGPTACRHENPVDPVRLLWQNLVAPCRGIWIGLAFTWLLIAGLHLDSDPSQPLLPRPTPTRSAAVQEQLEAQKQLLVELNGEPELTHQEVNSQGPGPRSAVTQPRLKA